MPVFPPITQSIQHVWAVISIYVCNVLTVLIVYHCVSFCYYTVYIKRAIAKIAYMKYDFNITLYRLYIKRGPVAALSVRSNMMSLFSHNHIYGIRERHRAEAIATYSTVPIAYVQQSPETMTDVRIVIYKWPDLLGLLEMNCMIAR